MIYPLDQEGKLWTGNPQYLLLDSTEKRTGGRRKNMSKNLRKRLLILKRTSRALRTRSTSTSNHSCFYPIAGINLISPLLEESKILMISGRYDLLIL